MRLLVDTHVLLWAIATPGRLPRQARAELESPDNDILFSAASIWEVAIKMQIGRLEFPVPPEGIIEAAVETGFAGLPVHSSHAAGVRNLPLLHRDPFDRLLIAQAIHEPARLLTADKFLARYSDVVHVIA